MMDVDALLFDIGGTVFDWRSSIVRALDELDAPWVTGIDAEAFSVHWRKSLLIEVEAVADETSPWRTFGAIAETSLQRTLTDFGIGSATRQDRKALFAAWDRMPAWPDVPSALARLRKRYFIAPLTILSLRSAAHSSKHAGLSWDAIISCDALGATKLNAKSYQRGLETVGYPGERVYLVAAHPSDLRAAQQHGMKTAYVVARLEDYGDSYENTGFAGEFDIVAADFAELADRLGH